MTFIRRIGAVALATPLAMSIPVISAPPAAADAVVVTPKDGAVITSGTKLAAKADADFHVGKVELRVSGPGLEDTLLDEQTLTDGELSGTFPITRNGSYKLWVYTLVYKEMAVSNFTVKVPPAAPTGVAAAVSGDELVVKWGLGQEADLQGYTLAGEGVKPAAGSIGTFCSGTKCSASLPLTRDSGKFAVEIRAQRSDGADGSVYSKPVTAGDTVAGASVPGGSAPGGSASTRLPTAAGSVPSATTPLTPFNEQSPITLPSVQPEGATPGLVYPAPEIASEQEQPVAQNVAATDQLQWSKSVGIALVLLVVAAHLGTWTRRLRAESVPASARGSAARIARGGTGRKRVTKAREHIARAEAVAKTGPVKPMGAAKAGSPKTKSAKGAPKATSGNGTAGKGASAKGTAPRAASNGTAAKEPASSGAPAERAKSRPSRRAPSKHGSRRPSGVQVKVGKSARK